MKTTVKMNFEELENVSGGRCMFFPIDSPVIHPMMQDEPKFEVSVDMGFKKRR